MKASYLIYFLVLLLPEKTFSQGIDFNTAYKAIENGVDAVQELLMQHGGDINQYLVHSYPINTNDHRTLLTQAIIMTDLLLARTNENRERRIAVVRYLLQNNANPNRPNFSLSTRFNSETGEYPHLNLYPIHQAIDSASYDSFSLLREHDADLSVDHHNGMNLLEFINHLIEQQESSCLCEQNQDLSPNSAVVLTVAGSARFVNSQIDKSNRRYTSNYLETSRRIRRNRLEESK